MEESSPDSNSHAQHFASLAAQRQHRNLRRRVDAQGNQLPTPLDTTAQIRPCR
jgi:hypothetical protein